MSILVGKVKLRNNVFLAPMSGVTDEPFRQAAFSAGAGLVVSEMVASEELVRERTDMLRRVAGAKTIAPLVIQLAGREARWMAEGAKIAEDLGAEIIDINMGCPARQVTGGLSGSALMRNLDHAITLIDATIAAVKVPITLKMRLGWDNETRNAPELAQRAEAAGIAMITVHGRTRCQFYTGKADWKAIRSVREKIKIPLIANGDCNSAMDAKEMMRLSGADGVMVGRSAYGRPWWPSQIAESLILGSDKPAPELELALNILQHQHQKTLELYGSELGNKTFRKHIGWTIGRLHESGYFDAQQLASLRQSILAEKNNARVARLLQEMFELCAANKACAA